MPSAVSSALSAGLTTMQGNVTDQIAAVLPLALGFVGIIAAVFFGIKLFRGVAHV